jgi:hypothetical protein
MPNMLSHAVKLLNKGYIPLRVASGTKAAKNPGWSSEIPTDISVHRDFARDSNLGVRCGDTHPDGTCLLAIDVDVDDAELFRCVEHAIGDKTVPVKRGKKGGTYFVRLDYEQKSCKIQLVRDGKKVNAIDVLCKGAQTVVPPSVHPDTSLPYRWIAGQQLQDVDYRALPVFGQALLDEIRGFCKDPSDPIVALNDMEWRGIGGGGNTHDVCVRAVASMVSRKWADEDIHQRIQRAKRVACEAAAMPFNWPESQKVIQEWIESSRAKGFGAPPRKQKRPSHGSIADAFSPKRSTISCSIGSAGAGISLTASAGGPKTIFASAMRSIYLCRPSFATARSSAASNVHSGTDRILRCDKVIGIPTHSC